jgi:hypothetical protein
LKHIRKRLTYANVMSSIAVFLVIGGATAFAALGKNTVGTKQLKKNAVTKAKIKDGAVTTSKLANDAATGEKVAESTLGQVPSAANATNAGNAQTLAGKTLNDIVMWASVNNNGALVRSSGGISSTKFGTGAYEVTFPRSVAACAYNVSNAADDGIQPDPNESAVALNSGSTVFVTTANDEGILTDDEFMIMVTC